MNLFNARLDLISFEPVSTDTFKITAKVIDNNGVFLAGNAKVGDVIYIDDSMNVALQRYSIESIAESIGANIVATVKWAIEGETPVAPVIGGSAIIGKKNTKSGTITLTSTTVNMVAESLETSVRNYEQDMLVDVMANKEANLSNPENDGEVLSSTKEGVRSWVALPSITDAINAVKGQPNGLAQLDANGKLVLNEVPAIAITDVFTVADEAAMLALTAEKGDIASRLDDGCQYVLAGDPTVVADWKKLSQPVPVQSVNGKTGIVVLTTSDIAEGVNLYYTDERVANAPAVKDLKTKVDALPTDIMAKSVYDKDGDGVVDKAAAADVAGSVDYADVTNKPVFAAVATSGKYTDLTATPVIPTKSSDLTLDNVYTKTEDDAALALKADSTSVYTKTETDTALALKANSADVYTKTQTDAAIAASGDMKKSVYDTNNSGVVDKAEVADVANSVDYANVTNKPSFAAVATSGKYTDLLNTPVIPSKSSDLTLDNVYTKTEDDAALALKANSDDVYTKAQTDTKVAGLINDAASSAVTTYSADKITSLLAGGSLVRYAVGEDVVLATGTGVTITKVGNAATVNCPAGVTIVSLSVHFNLTNMAGMTNCSIDFGSSVGYTGTGMNTAYSNMLPPIAQVINDVSGSTAYNKTAAVSYNTNSHTATISGLTSNIAVWVRLAF